MHIPMKMCPLSERVVTASSLRRRTQRPPCQSREKRATKCLQNRAGTNSAEELATCMNTATIRLLKPDSRIAVLWRAFNLFVIRPPITGYPVRLGLTSGLGLS